MPKPSEYGPWPSEPDWGIPLLDPSMQATELPDPPIKWGTRRRDARVDGTLHYYCDDYKFAAIWAYPERPIATGCTAMIEPNYSTTPGMARAEVLWGIYRKRWLARYWQGKGVRVVADLNVDPAFRDLALVGVPPGWSAYATRSHKGVPFAAIEADHSIACERAGTGAILFAVCGGKKIMRECERRGWAWIPEDGDRRRGRG